MDASQQVSIDLSAGIYIKGLPLGETSFLAVTKFGQLQAIMRNPRDLQPSARRVGYEAEQLEEEASIHELIQRALTGAKRSNVAKYGEYIYEVVTGRTVGVLPPIHAWSPEKLDVVMNGPDTYLLVPQSDHLLAIDGETQVTGHFEVPKLADHAGGEETASRVPARDGRPPRNQHRGGAAVLPRPEHPGGEAEHQPRALDGRKGPDHEGRGEPRGADRRAER